MKKKLMQTKFTTVKSKSYSIVKKIILKSSAKRVIMVIIEMKIE